MSVLILLALIPLIAIILLSYFLWIGIEKALWWGNAQFNWHLHDIGLVHTVIFIGLLLCGGIPGVNFLDFIFIIIGLLAFVGAV